MTSATVSNPCKITEKGRSYVVYTVSSSNDCVYRRYSDFTWLNKEISRQFPLGNMPFLPEKQTLGRFDINFLETRRKQLEKYLCQLLDRQEIVSSEIMVSFLTHDEFDFNSFKNKSQSQYTLSLLGSITSTVTGASETSRSSYWLYEGSRGNKSDFIEKTNADIKIDEIQNYITHAERHISAIVKEGEHMVNCNRLIATALYNNSHSFSYLGYGDGDTLGTAFNQLGSMSSALSDLTTEYAESEQTDFLVPLQEYLQSIMSIKNLIATRNERKGRYISSLLDLESKFMSCRKLEGIQGKESQLNSKQLLVERATVTLENNKNEYRKVTHQLLHEYKGYKREKDAAVKAIIMSFLLIQRDYYTRSHAIWTAASPILKDTNNIVPSVAASRSSNIFDDIDEEELFSV